MLKTMTLSTEMERLGGNLSTVSNPLAGGGARLLECVDVSNPKLCPPQLRSSAQKLPQDKVTSGQVKTLSKPGLQIKDDVGKKILENVQYPVEQFLSQFELSIKESAFSYSIFC
ncbi:hypothetical protein BTVI_159023 [Pitangus sulphuratus]|nr:hypothetical protein BTVI_159023 [Pitangus sulphuratus]